MRGGDGLLFDCLSGYCGGEVGFEVGSWLREWRRDQKCAGVDAGTCCRVVEWRGSVKCLGAEVRRISLRGRIHVEVSERASEQRDIRIAGTEEALTEAGGMRVPAGSWETSIHVHPHLTSSHFILHTTCGFVTPYSARQARLPNGIAPLSFHAAS